MNKHIKNLLFGALFVLMAVLFCTPADAQGLKSTRGRDFWVAYLYNSAFWYNGSQNYGHINALIISSEGPCSGTVSLPATGWSVTFSLSQAGVTKVDLPENTTPRASSLTSRGFHVTSTADISLYAYNAAMGSIDGTPILPTPMLGTEYVAQNMPCSVDTLWTEVAVVATQDSTQIEVISPVVLRQPQAVPVGTPVQYTINAGQVMSFKSCFSSDGLRVRSINGKPLAVFSGCDGAMVPEGHLCSDHLMAQLIPTDQWGREVVFASSKGMDTDLVKITTVENGCDIYRDGNYVATINAYQTYSLWQPTGNGLHSIRTTKPSQVYLYHTYFNSRNGYQIPQTDPFMAHLPAVDQMIDSVRFRPYYIDGFLWAYPTYKHVVNIVTRTSNVQHIRYDGMSISYLFFSYPTAPGWSYASFEVTDDNHTLVGLNGAKFLAQLYGGQGMPEGYGYSLGFCFPVYRRIVTADSVLRRDGDTIECCQGKTIRFKAVTDEPGFATGWSLPTNAALWDSVAQYHFDSAGTFQVEALFLYQGDTERVSLTVIVHPTYYESLRVRSCTLPYQWHNTPVNAYGSYHNSLLSIYGCDSLEYLYLSRPDSLDFAFADTICQGERYSYRGQDFDAAGSYSLNYPGPDGCDTTVVISLVVNPSYYDTTEVSFCEGDTLRFCGMGLTRSGAYDCGMLTAKGCDSLQHAILKVVPHPVAKMELDGSLDQGRIHIVAQDQSRQSDGREWWIGDQMVGTDEAVEYDFALEEPSCVTLVAVNQGLCSDTVERCYNVDGLLLWVPNVFTPDAADNREFVIKGYSLLELSVEIHDRQGRPVASYDGLASSWDGTKDGIPLPQGSYVWKVVARTKAHPLAKIVKAGTVTLLR